MGGCSLVGMLRGPVPMNPGGTLHKGRGPQLHVPYPITKSAHSRVLALLPAISFLGWPWRH